MICVSIAEKSTKKSLEVLKGLNFAEIRLDKMSVTVDDVRKIFSQHPRLIATCRPGVIEDKKRKLLLEEAISAGAAFVDLELEASDVFKESLIKKAHQSGCKTIISYHNFKKTPKKVELEHVVRWCFNSGADIAKIACRVSSREDNARLLGLLEDGRPLVVVAIGGLGKITRIVSLFLGSPFTYASLERGKETAEGQLDRETLKKIYKTLRKI